MGNWKIWLKGLVAAAVSSAASTIAAIVADPQRFSPAEAGGLKRLATVALVGAIVGVAMYLKQSPMPNGSAQQASKEARS